MKQVMLREWKDLSGRERESRLAERARMIIEEELEFLSADLEKGLITEADYYDAIGCAKDYAESTPWFIPACYYENNKDTLDALALEDLGAALYDRYANIVYP